MKVKSLFPRPQIIEKPSAQRSANMRAIKGKDTKPELLVRDFLKSKRFKIVIYPNLPGKPDIVLPARKIVVRIMGCFWHGHSCKRGKSRPTTNAEFWNHKISGNQKRDRKNKRALKTSGWTVLDIWECELKKPNWPSRLMKQIKSI